MSVIAAVYTAIAAVLWLSSLSEEDSLLHALFWPWGVFRAIVMLIMESRP